MGQAFIIMQIGDSALDDVCENAIVPALQACGLEPKRVDKHNEGGLLKSEIIAFIERADIIVADVTNERPNCYLEVGYAMGISKLRNLILTAREDHNRDSPAHKLGGPKVHFDLSGYDILYWRAEDIAEFRDELTKRIRRRQAVLPSTERKTVWDGEWIESQRERAFAGLAAIGKVGFMEVLFALDPPKLHKSQQDLDGAARRAQIGFTGWPIGVYLDSGDDRPRPTADGIIAEIKFGRGSYDYWSIRRSGAFYLLKSILEDERDPSKLYFDTRILRLTEAFLYCARLYTGLQVDQEAVVHIRIRHGGLKDRVLIASTAQRRLSGIPKSTIEDEVEGTVTTTIAQIETDLVALVKQVAAPLFTIFDLQEFAHEVYEGRVNDVVGGLS